MAKIIPLFGRPETAEPQEPATPQGALPTPQNVPKPKASVATVAEVMAMYFAKHPRCGKPPGPPCNPRTEPGHGVRCYALGATRDKVPQTLHGYHAALRTYGKHLDAQGRIDKNAIECWIQDIHLTHGRSENTANYVRRALKATVNVCADYFPSNKPMRRLQRAVARSRELKVPRKHQRTPNHDIVERCLPLCVNPMEEHMVILISRFGLRISEMLGLLPEDYHPHERCLYVRRQRLRKTRKSRADEHRIDVSDDDCRRIEWIIANRHHYIAKNWPKSKPRPGWLFPQSHDYWENLIKRFRDKLGDEAKFYFPNGTGWHAFRHLAGKNKMEELKGDPNQVTKTQKFMGHMHPSTTFGMYNEVARGPSVTTSLKDSFVFKPPEE